MCELWRQIMNRIWLVFLGTVLALAVLIAAGCAHPGGVGDEQVRTIVMPSVLPVVIPEGLGLPDDGLDQGAVLVEHEDGLLYARGLSNQAKVGDVFVLIYGGQWIDRVGE
jgi:hypothetical protein